MTRAASGDPKAAVIVKHSLTVAGHRTSISLESLFWERLQTIAKVRGCSLAALVADVDGGRGAANLSSALRVFILALSLQEGGCDEGSRGVLQCTPNPGVA